MSWDASLGDYWWNYTHNTNQMIADAYQSISGQETPQCGGSLGAVIGKAWWYKLDGMSAEEGSKYLAAIITGLETDPQRFRAMNPSNGWGSYDGLLAVLRQMEKAGREETGETWEISG